MRISFREHCRAPTDSWWHRICVHKPMLARIIHDGRVGAVRNDARSAASIKNRARSMHRRGCGHETAAQSITRRRLQSFPFLIAGCGQERCCCTPSWLGGKNTVFHVQRSLAWLVERVHGHDAKLAVLANENSGRRSINRARRMHNRPNRLSRETSIASVTAIAIISGRRIKPAATRSVEEPAAVVIRSPAPRLVAGKSPAETRIPQPLAHGEW